MLRAALLLYRGCSLKLSFPLKVIVSFDGACARTASANLLWLLASIESAVDCLYSDGTVREYMTVITARYSTLILLHKCGAVEAHNFLQLYFC